MSKCLLAEPITSKRHFLDADLGDGHFRDVWRDFRRRLHVELLAKLFQVKLHHFAARMQDTGWRETVQISERVRIDAEIFLNLFFSKSTSVFQ